VTIVPTEVTLPRWLSWIIESRWVSYVLLASGWALAVIAGSVRGLAQIMLLILGAALVVAHAIRVDFMTSRREKKIKDAEQAALDATEELILVLGDAFEPIAEILGRIAAEPSRPVRRNLAHVLIQKIVDAAARICGPQERGQTRSTFFRLHGDALQFVTHGGRGEKPRHERLPVDALELAKARGNVLIKDVADAPEGVDLTDASYKTFVSCSVYAGDDVLGLLTVDAVDPGTLRKTDLRSALVLANMLGVGLALAKN
jgi:hypothetical protein